MMPSNEIFVGGSRERLQSGLLTQRPPPLLCPVRRPCEANSSCFFFFQAEDGIRDVAVTGVPDVCSSDLGHNAGKGNYYDVASSPGFSDVRSCWPERAGSESGIAQARSRSATNQSTQVCQRPDQIGRASCRERV